MPSDWEPVSLGDEGVIDDLVLVDAALGFAASGTRVLRWDGLLWGPYGTPAEEAAVHGVWADDEVVVAVGEGGLAARRTTGSDWELLAGAPAVTLRAVVGRSADDVFAAGDDGTLVHWDGTTWSTKFTKDTFDLHAMWLRPGSTGDEGVYAVGSGGQLVTLNPTTGAWAASGITFSTVLLSDIIGLTNGTLIAVGDKHTITGRTTTAITWVAQVSNDTRSRDLSAIAESNGVARIFGASGTVLSGTGAGWNVDVTAASAAGVKPFAVADAAGDLTMALGESGDGVRLNNEVDEIWSTVTTRPDATLTSFTRAGDTLWAVGTKGFLARRGAQGWTTVPSGTTNDLFAVATISDDSIIAVGARGTILTVTDGVVRAVDTQVQADLYGVASDGDVIIVCGRGGTLVAIGEEITPIAAGTTADLKAVTYGADGRFWVAGVFGTLLRLDATNDGVTAMASGVGGALSALTGFGDGVLVVGDNGVVLRANATSVVLENESPGAFLYAVGAAGGVAIAAGSNGLVLVREGSTWVPELATERGATFDAIYVGSDEALIGGAFRVMHVESRKVVTP